MSLTAIDLFSGAGGFSLGLEKAGCKVLFAVDAWAPAVNTYRNNFRHPIFQCDVRSLDANFFRENLAEVRAGLDLIVGGPPCQGFSVQRIGEDSDERNNLILEFARIVSLVRPRMFLMENVPGLLGKRGQSVLHKFRKVLGDAGYYVDHQRVNAADYGVPQKRNRVFFFGTLRAIPSKFVFPAPTHSAKHYVTVQDALKGLPPVPRDYTPHPDDPLHKRMKISKTNLERLKLIPPGGGFESLPVELRVDCHKNGAEKIGHRYVYGRLAPDEPAGVITARFDSFTRGKFAHPLEHRNITLREGARLQTFPDSFRFLGTQEEAAAQIGNAVPPLLAEKVGRAISSFLGKMAPLASMDGKSSVPQATVKAA